MGGNKQVKPNEQLRACDLAKYPLAAALSKHPGFDETTAAQMARIFLDEGVAYDYGVNRAELEPGANGDLKQRLAA